MSDDPILNSRVDTTLSKERITIESTFGNENVYVGEHLKPRLSGAFETNSLWVAVPRSLYLLDEDIADV